MLQQEITINPSPLSLSVAEAGRLAGTVRPVAKLRPGERRQMYRLLARYFNNVQPDPFERDLAEKEWVVLLTDMEQGQIRGFSTLMRLQTEIDGQPVVAFFSGDTIIEPAYWGETLLPRLWGRHVFGLAQHLQGVKVYWFLISSGYKTYRCLPVFFREFYPTYERPTPPALKQVLDYLGRLKFPAEYHADQGIIRFNQAAPLRPGVAEITGRRLKDPHVAFFAAANPGHVDGDELACLVELTPSNLTPAGRRVVGI